MRKSTHVLAAVGKCIAYFVEAVDKIPFGATVQWTKNLKPSAFSFFLDFLSMWPLLRTHFIYAFIWALRHFSTWE